MAAAATAMGVKGQWWQFVESVAAGWWLGEAVGHKKLKKVQPNALQRDI